MHINIRLFHRPRDISGNTVLSKDIDENSTLRQLVDRIAEDEGGLNSRNYCWTLTQASSFQTLSSY